MSWRAVLVAAALASAALVIQAAAWWSPYELVGVGRRRAGRGRTGRGGPRARPGRSLRVRRRAAWPRGPRGAADVAGPPRRGAGGTGVPVASGPAGLGHGAARRDGSLAPHPGCRHGPRHAQRRRGGGDRGPRTGPLPPRRHVVECGGVGGRRGAGTLRRGAAAARGRRRVLAGRAGRHGRAAARRTRVGRRGGGRGAARQHGVARAGAPCRPRCADVDGQRPGARAHAQAAQRRPPGGGPPSELGRGAVPSPPRRGRSDCRGGEVGHRQFTIHNHNSQTAGPRAESPEPRARGLRQLRPLLTGRIEPARSGAPARATRDRPSGAQPAAVLLGARQT